MDVVYKICCGIDVHKKKIVACLRKGRKEEIKEFGTTSKEIRKMANWLKENECEMVAMESTSVYWKPLVNIFETECLDYMVVNAAEVKNRPGRKTDILDAQWICELLQHGMLRASYIPTREQRELRTACRYRQSLTQERAKILNRLQDHLEGANIKLSTIVSDISGVTALQLLDYVLNNEELLDEAKAEELIITRISAGVAEVVEAMDGIVTPFQKLMIKEVIEHLNALAIRIKKMDEIIDEYMTEYQEAIELLVQIPGIGRKSAEVILAETGVDMSRFETAGHLAAWAGVSPGNNESAGKRRSVRSLKGNKTLKSTLVRSAMSGSKDKFSFFHAQKQRIAVRRGKKRANLAVAHSMLIAIYHMLKDGKDFVDLGADYYNQFNTEKKANSYIKKLQSLGYHVTVTEVVAAT